MYAIIKTAGKQYRVAPGDVVRLDKLQQEVGAPVEFDHVLVIQDEEKAAIGQPLVEKARVVGTVVETGRARKIKVLKFKRRKQYRVRRGHRQPYTDVRIEAIHAEGQSD